MQIEINGKRNINLDFDAPKKFKLLKDGAEVPYIRTGKNSFRLGRGVDGFVELEEIIEEPKIVSPMRLQPQQLVFVNPNDILKINQAAQQLETEQRLLAETQKELGYTQNYLMAQQEDIDNAVADIKNLETSNAERITATEGGIFKLAGEIANVENNANEGINSVFEDVEAHKRADNPHNITKKTIGLDKVDNTRDQDKPVSKAVQKALDEKADKTEIAAIREEIGEYQEKNEKISNALSSYTGGLASGSISDHRELDGRDFPDQHPIEAITGLQTALDGKVNKTSESSKVYGTDEIGQQTTYDLSQFGGVSDVRVDGETVVTDNVVNLGSMALEDADDYSTKAVADTLYAAISYETTIDNHVSDKNNPHEVTKAQVGLGNVDNTPDLNKPISTATQTALNDKQNNLNTTQMAAVNSGANTTNIGQIATNTSDIGTINGKIPSAASSSNQLADKEFVNSSISTNTARFIGTFSSVTALESYSGTITNNDYAFVVNSVITDNDNDWATFAALDAYNKALLTNFDYGWVVNGSNFDLYRFDILSQTWNLRVANIQKSSVTLNTAYNRYKATVTNSVSWEWEYTLNNSSFTASQWAAINSGITSGDVSLIATALQPNDNISELFNNAGYITGITSSDVTTALGYTPYDSSNPSGFITSSALSGYLTTSDIVSSVSSSSDNTKAVGAKLFYDTCGDIETLINAL